MLRCSSALGIVDSSTESALFRIGLIDNYPVTMKRKPRSAAARAKAAGIAGTAEQVAADMTAFSETERERFLEAKHVAVLSVAATDGRPPASVPIWYDYTPGGDIRISTGAGSRKAKLIERAGAVTVVVQREEPPYQYVAVEGTVVDTTEPTPLDV